MLSGSKGYQREGFRRIMNFLEYARFQLHQDPTRYLLESIVLSKEARTALEKSLEKNQKLLSYYSANQNISESTWMEIYKKIGVGDVAVATNLTNRVLTEDVIDWVIKNEKRNKPLIALIESNTINEDQIDKFLSNRLSKDVFRKIINPKMDGVTLKKLFEKSGDVPLLSYLVGAEEGFIKPVGTYAEVEKALAEVLKNKKPTQYLIRVLNVTLERYPDLASKYSSTENLTLRTQIASCTKINLMISENIIKQSLDKINTQIEEKYPLYALVANPATPMEALEKLTEVLVESEIKDRVFEQIKTRGLDAEKLTQRKLKRATPNEYRPQGRPFELLELLKDSVDKELTNQIKEAFLKLPLINLPLYELCEKFPEIYQELDHTREGMLERYKVYLDEEKQSNEEKKSGDVRLSEKIESHLGKESSRWEIFINMLDQTNLSIDEVIERSSRI
jgi:hypothetical protein